MCRVVLTVADQICRDARQRSSSLLDAGLPWDRSASNCLPYPYPEGTPRSYARSGLLFAGRFAPGHVRMSSPSAFMSRANRSPSCRSPRSLRSCATNGRSQRRPSASASARSYQPPPGWRTRRAAVFVPVETGSRNTRCPTMVSAIIELWARQTRKPRLLFVFSGLFLLRLATRQFSGWLFQLPPRFTRLEALCVSLDCRLSPFDASAEPGGVRQACCRDQ